MTLPLIVIATNNKHKTEEIAAMLNGLFEVKDLSSYPDVPKVEETGETFAENAALKAVAASRMISGIVLADDSGLCVDALGGKPGVRSARFGGEEGNHTLNNARMLQELSRLDSGTTLAARFVCTMVLARGGEVVGEFSGVAEGSMLREMKGAQGFGYDPLFQPFGYDRSFAELSGAEKNGISHRGKALRQVVDYLKHHVPDKGFPESGGGH